MLARQAELARWEGVALRIARAIDNATVHTLWMDPVLNDRAYIMPGLGDAGDRQFGTAR